uniref:Acetylglutamate kinase n=1 Tax=Gastroclonium compressum TaxID=1852973 RepID=A0A173G087_GASCM|nr:acetylglutamate kinase [Coeloseira compressa]ANH09692.1 acetylglutamate kinase [Coeloseira compressa]
MLNNSINIQILNEIIPSIKDLAGSVIVIKYGGASMINNSLKMKVIEDIMFLHFIGVKIVLVHGGGPTINTWLKKMNIEPKFSNGVRLTDFKTMEIVEMVLSGKINKQIVSLINQHKPCAIGLSGKDANLVIASNFSDQKDNYVGYVKHVNLTLLNLLLSQGYIPVISSVASDNSGKTYNINADSMSASIASSLRAKKLILLTDTPGIMHNINDPLSRLKSVSTLDIFNLKKNNIISGGMIPKVDACVYALKCGVQSVHIIDGRVKHSLMLEMFDSNSTGSTLTL